MGLSLKALFDAGQTLRLGLELITGEKGLERELTTARIQKPGLLLTGLLDELHSDRIQIFGAAEVGYLNSLKEEKLSRSLKLLEKARVPAIIVTRGLALPDYLVELCGKNNIPLYRSTLTSSAVIEDVTQYLDERLAPTITMHGVLVDVLGVGILLIGKSGIGKSECALDLVSRGSRLVSDDIVIIKRMPPSTLFGTSAEVIRYHIEIRGLGIVNIKDIFGITAIREQKQMDLVVELVKWEPKSDYERLGFEESTYEILGVQLPYLKVPVSPGRSVATIIEVAARNQILKIMGHHSARILKGQLEQVMNSPEKDAESVTDKEEAKR